MTNNTRKTMSNKYWENETPIVTETDFGGISYFKTAGKIQLYGMYESKEDGELHRGRGCTWDNNDMEADDAVRLVHGLMQGLLDVGVENDAFAEAYDLIHTYVNEELADEENVEDDEPEDETLDEEFEDETPDYNEFKLNDLKSICKERGLELPKRATKSALVKLLEEDDALTVDAEESEPEDEEVTNEFIGKHVKYVDGKLSKVKKTVKKDYIEWCEDAIEWSVYIAERAGEIKEMPTKTKKQKSAQDKAYAEFREEIAEWVEAWEEDDAIAMAKEITKDLMFLKMDAEIAIIKFVAIVDAMDF